MDLSLDGRAVSRKEFVELLEKRMKKQLREAKLSKGQRVIVVSEFCAAVVRKLIGGLPLAIEMVDEIPANSNELVITPLTLDDVACDVLGELLLGNKVSYPEKCIHLFAQISNEDMSTYASLTDQAFSVRQQPDSVRKLLAKIRQVSPQSPYNLLKTSQLLHR